MSKANIAFFILYIVLILTGIVFSATQLNDIYDYEFPDKIESGKLMRMKHGCFYLPKGYNSKKQYPLVITLHPMSTGEETFIYSNNLTDYADKRGYILLAVRATKLVWEEEPDSGTILKMASVIKTKLPINKKRILLTGFSSGGHFTLTMLLYNRRFFTSETLFTAFAAGGGGAGYELGIMMGKNRTPNPKTPGYIYWGIKEPGVPGKEVSEYLLNHGWNIVANEHPGHHFVPDGEFERIFDWFDNLELN
ncbi:MAG TPA: hypothetical protein P5123_08130 [Spirochaetota bacterium]|nr:hypothetical protein [Spirochaetota bacterium]